MTPILMSNSILRARRAFTLLEMLVAVAIVAVLVILVNQIIGSASTTTMVSQKKMDATSQAQQVLDRMAFDFAQMPQRTDIDYGFSKAPLPTDSDYGSLTVGRNDTFSFYSSTEGLYPATSGTASTPRNLSIIGYRITTDPAHNSAPRLERGARQLDWTAGGAAGETIHYVVVDGTGGQSQTLDGALPKSTLPLVDPTASGTSNYQAFSDQVFRLEICYLVKGDPSLGTQPKLQTTLPTNLTSLLAVVVAIGVLDARSRILVTDYSKLIAALSDAKDGQDILAVWTPILNSPDFLVKTNLPPPAAQSVRIFQRYFYLE